MEQENRDWRLAIGDWSPISNRQSLISFIILMLALLTLAACQGGTTEEVSSGAAVQPSPVPVTDTAAPTATIQSTATPLPTATEPKLMPSFNLVEESEVAPTAVPLTPTNTAVAATETPTNTPQP
ncbi:MAG: hypothetical protein HF973_11800, partial [Chloroflexi bacterium]|nr:hypothetical protein [Chloroflexota bacterium]